MIEWLSQLESLRGEASRVVLATLVATRGSVPRGEGAKMLVGSSGRVLGTVTIGGCVDARVLQETALVLADGRARRVLMEIGDEDAMALGLTCGGSIELLVEPVEPDRRGDPVMAAARALEAYAAAGHEAACIARLDGGGGRIVVGDDGVAEGSLGDAMLDVAAVELAEEAMRTGSSRIGRATDATGAEVELFAERYAQPMTIAIFGASEVAVALVPLAASLGWRTVIVDGREQWATRERFPLATELRVGLLGDIARELTWGPRSAAVIVAHDYRVELPVLRTVLRSDAGYVGLLGNRRRVAALLDLVADGGGVPRDALQRLHAPVGLDIGARSPTEIAIAIVAEVLAVTNRRPGGSLALASVAAPGDVLRETVRVRPAGA